LSRKREVLSISWKRKGPKKIELIVKGSAGLYIKELVSGDNGRTKPSVSEILGVPAKVKELDVIRIGKVQ
jgi:tRNA pseudouridine synthase 10